LEEINNSLEKGNQKYFGSSFLLRVKYLSYGTSDYNIFICVKLANFKTTNIMTISLFIFCYFKVKFLKIRGKKFDIFNLSDFENFALKFAIFDSKML